MDHHECVTYICKMVQYFEKFFLSTLFALLVCSGAHAQGNMRIVVFGDSLTSGYQLHENESYPNKLDYKLKEIGYKNVDVINMSVTGQTTSRAAQMTKSVIAKRPDVVVLQLGANDMLRGVNTDLIYNNLINIIGRLQQKKIYTILLGIKAPENTDYSYSRQLQAVYERIVNFYRIPFYPNILDGIVGNPDLNLADGYHPNGKGIDVMVNNSYIMVDKGLRHKWNKLNEQSHYQEPTEALPPAMPLSVDPPLLPPSLRRR